MIRRTFQILATAALVFAAGCSSDRNPVATNAEPTGTASLQGGSKTGVVSVVHGVPGLTVDVYVNGALTLPSFEPGTITDPLTLPEGSYDIVIVPAGGDFPDDAAIEGSAFLPAGANASIVAHLAEDGTPSLTTFVNDVSPGPKLRSRVVVRHVAEAPTVDVRLFRRVLSSLPVRAIEDLSNPNEAQTSVFPGTFQAKLYPANSRDVVFTSPYLTLLPRESTIVYAIGSLTGGSFDLLVQKIALPTSRNSALGVDAPTGLSAAEYDRIAVEQNLDALE